MMRYQREESGDEIVLSLRGDLDGMACDDLEHLLYDATESPRSRLILDMAEVPYLTSRALGLLMMAFKRQKSRGCTMELTKVQPAVNRILNMVGFGKLFPITDAPMQVIDVLQGSDSLNSQARDNARNYLAELMEQWNLDAELVTSTLEKLFSICQTGESLQSIETKLKSLLSGVDFKQKLTESLSTRPEILKREISPYVIGCNELLLVDGSGVENLASELLDDEHEVQRVTLKAPSAAAEGDVTIDPLSIPAAENSSDAVLLITLLNHTPEPMSIIKQAMKITRRRIIVLATVYLNESHRRYCMFFDWFYRRVLGDDAGSYYHFNTPEGWSQQFRQEGLQIKASVDIGMDQPSLPEYHWMYVLDLPVM